MTITNTVKQLPSGKPGLNIIANIDEVSILRGLVVNALRHMPDVGETTSTRQRLKAMSRALHRVYGSVASSTSWPVITKPSPGPDVTLSRILNSMPEEFYTADFITKAELAGCTKEVSIMYLQSLVGDNLLTMSADTLKFYKAEMPKPSLFQPATAGIRGPDTSDYVKAPVDWPFITTPSVRTATATPEQVSKIVAMIRDCERRDWKASTFVGGQCGKNWAKKYMKAQARETDLAVQSLYGQLEIQGQDGNWNCNSYMMGLYNGIELAIATLENREPRYRNKPETGWLDDKLPAGLADAPVATAGIRGPDTLVAYADPKPSVDPLTAEKMAQQPQFIEPIVHCKKIQPQSTEEAPPAQVARYGGRPIIYKKPVLPGVSDQLPRYMPFTDQESLMKLLAEMPTEFRFDEFHKRVLHCVKAVNAAMHGTVTKKAELQVVQECNTFLLALPKNVFEVDGVFQTVKRLGSVVVDPKSIPNPDYVSPATPTNHDNSTDLKQASVPEEARGQVQSPYVPVQPPAGATKPTLGITGAATKRTTLFEVYDKMDEKFTFEALANNAVGHGHDRPKVSAFVNLMCQIGSLRHEGGFKYTKLSNVREPDMRRLASLIA